MAAIWRATPGSIYQYGWNKQTKTPLTITIAAVANVRYVATWGNDLTGDGSMARPYATLAFASSVAGAITQYVVGAGIYYNDRYPAGNARSIIGDGVVKFITTSEGTNFGANLTNIVNILFINYNVVGNVNSNYSNVSLINSFSLAILGVGNFTLDIIKTRTIQPNLTVLNSNYRTVIYPFSANFSVAITRFSNSIDVSLNNNRIYTLSTQISGLLNHYHCLLIGNNYQFGATAPVTVDLSNTTLFPNQTPEGRIQYLRIAAQQRFGGLVSDYFINSYNIPTTTLDGIGGNTIQLFNDESNDDYTLHPNCPDYVKYGGEFGTALGATEVADKALPSLDFPNITDYRKNITINADNFEITNPNDVDGYSSARSKIKHLGKIRAVNILRTFGFESFRNGQMFDGSYDLNKTVIVQNTALTNLAAYLVQGDGVTYPKGSLLANDQYVAGQRFVAQTTLTGAGLDYTTFTGTGTLRQIREMPNRQSVLFRYSSGGSLISVSPVQNYWYLVYTGSITLNVDTRDNDGNTIIAGTPILEGTIFITPNTTFVATGTYSLMEIYSETKPFLQYEQNYYLQNQIVGGTQVGTADLERTYVGQSNANIVNLDSVTNPNPYVYANLADNIKARFFEYIVKITLDNQPFSE